MYGIVPSFPSARLVFSSSMWWVTDTEAGLQQHPVPACLSLILLCDVYPDSSHFLLPFPFPPILREFSLLNASSQLLDLPKAFCSWREWIQNKSPLPAAQVPSQAPTAMAERGWCYLLFSEHNRCRTALLIQINTRLWFFTGIYKFLLLINININACTCALK